MKKRQCVKDFSHGVYLTSLYEKLFSFTCISYSWMKMVMLNYLNKTLPLFIEYIPSAITRAIISLKKCYIMMTMLVRHHWRTFLVALQIHPPRISGNPISEPLDHEANDSCTILWIIIEVNSNQAINSFKIHLDHHQEFHSSNHEIRCKDNNIVRNIS